MNSEVVKIDKNSVWYKNKHWKRDPLKNPEAEKMAQMVATYLPDVGKFTADLNAGKIKYPSNIVRWELTAINDRAWSIYLENV